VDGLTATTTPDDTAPTPLSTTPVPPLKAPVSVVLVPAVMVPAADVKLVMLGAATTVTVVDEDFEGSSTDLAVTV
jgi:hypothetical protein